MLASVLVTVLLLAFAPPQAAPQVTEADVFVAQGVLDFDEKRFDDALANLNRALEIEPGNVEALYYTGLVHLARNRPAEAIPFLERARKKSKDDPLVAFQLGVAHFTLQEYERAEPLLEGVFRRDPSKDGLGYYVGFMRYRKKDYRGAIDAFRAGQARNPELQQLTRFYTGLALGVLGLPVQAAAEVERALRLAPGSELTGPAERLRDTLVAARGRERRLLLEARLGFFYDDNVAVVPNADGGEPLVTPLRGRAHESTGELAALRAEYAWLRTEQWEATAGASFFGTYNNDLPSFNILDFLGSAGVTRKLTLGAMPAQASLQYVFDTLFLDREEFIQRHTVALSGVLAESALHLTQVFARYQNKEFNEERPLPAEEFRDADNWTVGAVHLLRFSQDRHFLKAGYQFDLEDADGKNYAYRGHRLLAGGQYTLPWKQIRLKDDLDVHFRDYVHKNSLLPTTAPDTTRRSDTEITNVVRVEVPLPWSLTLSAEYLSSVNDSNLAVFDYTRNVYSLILSWTY